LNSDLIVGISAFGGAIYNEGNNSSHNATLNVAYNSVFDTNKAEVTSNGSALAFGGAIYNGAYADANISNSTFTSNEAVATSNGPNTNVNSLHPAEAEAIGGAINNEGKTTISNSTFTLNNTNATSSQYSQIKSFG
jgi:hypothetical protein